MFRYFVFLRIKRVLVGGHCIPATSGLRRLLGLNGITRQAPTQALLVVQISVRVLVQEAGNPRKGTDTHGHAAVVVA